VRDLPYKQQQCRAFVLHQKGSSRPPIANLQISNKFSSAAIRVRTDPPDHGGLSVQELDWCYSVYVDKVLLKDLPKPLGKSVTTVREKDANLCMI
jgi:hypothetical protein